MSVTKTSPRQIRQAEKILKNAGHDPGPVDGKRTEKLTSSLRTYQRAVGLDSTGKLNAATMKKLRATATAQREHSDQFVTSGMKGGSIKTIEARLQKLGYDVGKVDGLYTRATASAVKEFKADNKKLGNTVAGMGIPAQALLAKLAGKGIDGGGTGKDTNVRATTFNWPARYRKGGIAADQAMFRNLAKNADVIGMQEIGWGASKIVPRSWGLYHPDPKGDGEKGKAGQAVAWNKEKFSLVKSGTSLLNLKTKVQQNAAGPTMHNAKSVIWTKLRNKQTGEIWTVASVHFVPSKHLGGAALKLWKKQRDELAEWIKAQGPRTIVMGDFNGQWKESVSKPLHKVAKAQSAPSHGKREIDWILRSKDLEAKGGGKALDNRGQSDHRPVTSVVRG